jgi:hypothetical protein
VQVSTPSRPLKHQILASLVEPFQGPRFGVKFQPQSRQHPLDTDCCLGCSGRSGMLSLMNQACHTDIMKIMCLACNGMRHAANVPPRLSNMRLLIMVLKKTTPPTAATEAEAMQVQAVWLAKAVSM